MLPTAFQQQMQEQLGEEYSEFVEALQAAPPISIRLNPKKSFTKQDYYQDIPWSNGEGFYLPKRPSFTLDPAFHAGAYYVQEASSMFVGEVIRQINPDDKALKVLDLCAAPGGKSTTLLSALNDQSLLVANEVIRSRYSILKHNLAKWGYPNIAVTNHDSKDFADLEGFFDVVLVDAPCSGEGLFRKDENARKEWSLQNVELCTGRSKRILAEAADLVKEGGHLIFSTCTYNDSENIGNAQWLTEEFDYQEVKVVIPAEWGITEKAMGYQFYPHKTLGEGFYLAVFQKGKQELDENLSGLKDLVSLGFRKKKKRQKSQQRQFKNLDSVSNRQLSFIAPWIERPADFGFFNAPGETILALPKHLIDDYLILDAALRKKSFGAAVGSFKRDDFIPAAGLAMSTIINSNVRKVEVHKSTALQFLRKEELNKKIGQPGWVLLTYRGMGMGWVKVLKNRINNYYPKNWRILMRS